MTDLRQAAQQALEAWDDPMKDLKDLCVAMDALRTALEQQAEPVAWMDREGDLYKMPEIKNWAPPHTMLYTTPPQQQAEPIAYFDFQELKFTWAKHMKIGPVPVSIKVEPLKLYSEATQRQWQGLTDEDWAKVADMRDTFDQGVAWAQARLKEKNT